MEDWTEFLLGGLFVFVLGVIREIWLKWRRTQGHQGSLKAEFTECARLASVYRNDKVKAPLYRLPTTCYGVSFPALLSDGAIKSDHIDAMLKFYGQVETLNRGLDIADAFYQSGDGSKLEEQYRRNLMKAEKIAIPSGEYYKALSNL